MSPVSKKSLEPQLNIRFRIEIVIYLAICVALAFIPLYSAGWVYDDINLIQPSPALENLAGLGRSISTDLYSQAASRLEVSAYWRPIAMASYWLNTRFGDAPLNLHMGNILIHAISTALLAFIIIRRHKSKAGIIAALLAAAWWALHPVNVEPVAWISCRYDLLCGLALLGLLVLPWRPGPVRALLYGIIFLAGLLAKEGFGMMAMVIVAIDFVEHRPVRAAFWRWGAVILALLIWIGLRSAVGIKGLDFPPLGSFFEIIRNYMEAIAIYFWRALASTSLTISHPYSSGGILVVLAGIMIFIGFAITAYFHRQILVPVVIFLAGLVPMAGAMTMFQEVPERYFYVPSIGLALMLAELMVYILSLKWRFIRIAVPVLVGIVLIFGIIQLELRLPDWRDDNRLWKAALRVEPNDPLANHYQAIAAGKRYDWEGALKYIKIAVKGNPDSGRFVSTYAWILLQIGDFKTAAREAERATILAPYQPNGWFYMASALHNLGDHDGELVAVERLLEIDPNYPGAAEAYKVVLTEVSGQKKDSKEGKE